MSRNKTKWVSYSEKDKKPTDEYIDDEILAERKRREESLKKAALKEKLRRKAKGGKIDKEKLRNKVNKIKRQQEVVKKLQSKQKELPIPPIRRSTIVQQDKELDHVLKRPEVPQAIPQTSRHSSGASRKSLLFNLPDVSRRHSMPSQRITQNSPDIKKELQTKVELPTSSSSKVKPSDSKPRKKSLFGSIRSLFGSEKSDTPKDVLPKTKPLPPINKKDIEEAESFSLSPSDNLDQNVMHNDAGYLVSVESQKGDNLQETDIPKTSNHEDLEQKASVKPEIDITSNKSAISVETTETETLGKAEIHESTNEVDLEKTSTTSEFAKSDTSDVSKVMCEIGVQTEELWESEEEDSSSSDTDNDSTTQDIAQIDDSKSRVSIDVNNEQAGATCATKSKTGSCHSKKPSDILRKVSVSDGDPIHEDIPDRLGSVSRQKRLKKLKGTLKKCFASNEPTYVDWLRLIHSGFGKDDEFEVDPKLEIKIWDLDPNKDYDQLLSILMEDLERENEFCKYKLKRVKQDKEYLIKEEEYMEKKQMEQLQQEEDKLLSYEEQKQADYYREKQEKAERLRQFMKKFPVNHRDPKKTPEIESPTPSTPGFGHFDQNYVYNIKKKTADFQVQGTATQKFKESTKAVEEAKQLMLDAMHSGFKN